MARKINRIPFNTIPQQWAFDPVIGPFIRELLTIIWQSRERVGGDDDTVEELQDYDIGQQTATSLLKEFMRLDSGMAELSTAPKSQLLARISELERRLSDIEFAAQRALPRTIGLDYIDFAETAPHVTQDRRVAWNPTYNTLDIGHVGGVTQQIGLETYIYFQNNTGSTITNGMALGIDTAIGVVPFIADGTMPSQSILGIATQDVADGEYGRLTTFGRVHDLDTSAWSVGDVLYPSPTVAGDLQNTKPTAPDVCIPIASVRVDDATDGVIFVRPTIEQQDHYGTFSDANDQTMAAVYTPQAVTFDTTDAALGFSVVSNSQITAEVSGYYEITFSAQLESGSSSIKLVWFWFRKNGTDIANSNTSITISGGSWTVVPAWNYPVSMDAGDYIELVWAADSTNVSLSHHPSQAGATGGATFARPAIPSVILTMQQIAQ